MYYNTCGAINRCCRLEKRKGGVEWIEPCSPSSSAGIQRSRHEQPASSWSRKRLCTYVRMELSRAIEQPSRRIHPEAEAAVDLGDQPSDLTLAAVKSRSARA